MTLKWDKRFLNLCEHISEWSRDPKTRVGAVIVNDDKQIIGHGYNGFPRGVIDSISRYHNRDLKIQLIVHAEANAILNANSSVKGCTIYTNKFTCNECAKLIIQSGIKRVISWQYEPESHWLNSYIAAQEMYKESKIEVILL